MTSLLKHRIAGGVMFFLGMFLFASGLYPLLFRLKSNPFTWGSFFAILFGVMLAAGGLYGLQTGTLLPATLLSRLRGILPTRGPQVAPPSEPKGPIHIPKVPPRSPPPPPRR